MVLNNNNTLPYRECVVAVFINNHGDLLTGKRTNMNTWQFPQGGIDSGETPLEALYRETLEEIGCNDFEVVCFGKKFTIYDFPKDLDTKITKKYRGQKQHWFLCKYNVNAYPDLNKAQDKEFDELKWVSPQTAFENIINWKKDSYRNGLRELGFEIKE